MSNLDTFRGGGIMAKGKFSLTDLLNANSQSNEGTNSAFDKITGAANDFKIDFISVYNLEPSTDNFYSVEDVADLKDSIELLGVQQNLTVVPLSDDKYKVIAGHRRRLASLQLAEEGKKQFELVPCRIEINLDDIKEQILLIYTNSTTRKLSSWEQMEQMTRLKFLLKEYKKEHELPGRVRELLAEALNISTSQVGRIESINDNLTEEFKKELKQDNISFSAAAQLARLSPEDQKSVYEQHQQTGSTKLRDIKMVKNKETIANSSSITIIAAKRIKSILEAQIDISEHGRSQELKITSSEVTVNTERIRILNLLLKTVDKEIFELMGVNIFEE